MKLVKGCTSVNIVELEWLEQELESSVPRNCLPWLTCLVTKNSAVFFSNDKFDLKIYFRQTRVYKIEKKNASCFFLINLTFSVGIV